MAKTVSITCPHCNAVLEVDLDAGVVLTHHPPRKETRSMDLEERLQAMEEAKARAEDRMAEAFRAEKAKERVMEDRFRKLLENAKDSADEAPPLKDIDLD